ncbi:aspartate/glutamate racemase family protein [Chelatococcus sp. SYSU_G07232]|uniref:Aspartate/glutamate racemase family protein n=1 Tax=Chelatococcus albus TaxID=3047466 RepID=A0ABT7AD77_9HYPH|nr:aspartate/glutamate racemase family protein [Chelatococcus sp. SYSU_G07232]MDJ1157338.1 aspartate/glutamate racemase family protein [Chelatococcus sp. SYSU_G07232]
MTAAPRSLLLINGNTDAALTRRLVERARALLPHDREVVGATALYGADYIDTRADAVVAAHAIVETITAELRQRPAAHFDACLIACFGEPGIGAARELFPLPIIGMAEASILSALQLGERFAIVTAGARWPGMLRELMRQQRLEERCCAVLALDGRAPHLATRPHEARDAIGTAVVEAVEVHRAEVVIIGGAALAGFAQDLQPRCDVPLVCSFAAALAQAEALAALRRAGTAPRRDGKTPPTVREMEAAGR